MEKNNVLQWFSKEEMHWRSMASLIWTSGVLPLALLCFVAGMNFSLWSPLLWISDSLSSALTLSFIFTTITLQLLLSGTTYVFKRSTDVTPTLHLTPAKSYLHVLRPRQLLNVLLLSCVGFLTTVTLNTVYGLNTSSLIVKDADSSDLLSDRPVFISGLGFFLGIFYVVTYYQHNLYAIKFPLLQQKRIFRVKKVIAPCIQRSVLLSAKALQLYYIVYLFLGFLPRHILSILLGSKFKCDASYSAVFTNLLDLQLLWTSFLIAATTIFLWELSRNFFQIFNTEHFKFPVEASFVEEQNHTLKDALLGESTVLKYLAFLDLSLLSKSSSSRRQQVFNLSAPGNQPHTWNSISEECLKLMNDLHTLLQKECAKKTASRGGSTNPPVKPPSPDLIGAQQLFSPIQGANQEILDQKKVWWASPGPLIHRVHKPVDTPLSTTPTVPVKAKPVAAPVREVFADIQLYYWCLEGLSNLVAASLTDDKYGAAQRKLGDIISSLLSLLESCEAYTKATIAPQSYQLVSELQTSQANASHATSLKIAIKSAIYQVTTAFGQHLNAVKLAGDHKKRLQEFLNYAE